MQATNKDKQRVAAWIARSKPCGFDSVEVKRQLTGCKITRRDLRNGR
jgi:hypothetical protein